jgi:lipopolysaccharide export system permease protein
LNILKRLIFKEWFKAFIGAAAVLLVLIAVANLISGFLRSSVTPWEVVINFILDLPRWINKLLPVSCLVATLFSINKLLRRNELIAICSLGFSRRDFTHVIIQASFLVALFQFFNSAVLDPFSKKIRYAWVPQTLKKFRHDKGVGLKKSGLESGKIWFKSGNYFFSYVAFDKDNNTLNDVSMYYYTTENKLQTLVNAAKAINVSEDKWKFVDGEKYFGLSSVNFPQYIKFDEDMIVMNERAQDFKDIDSDINTLGIIGLTKFIYKIRQSGISSREYEMLLYKKLSDSLVCILFGLVSIMAIFNPNRRGSSFGKSVVFTFVFTILYFLVDSSFQALGTNGKVPAFMASFAIPFVFSLYIAYKYYKNRQLT